MKRGYIVDKRDGEVLHQALTRRQTFKKMSAYSPEARVYYVLLDQSLFDRKTAAAFGHTLEDIVTARDVAESRGDIGFAIYE